MPETECFVCGLSLALFDEAAANFHLNACLDGGGGATTAVEPPSLPCGPNSKGIALIPRALFPQCPVCEKELPQDDVQDHVEACLLASHEARPSIPGQAATEEVSGTSSLGDDIADGCPCCMLDWSAMEVPLHEREVHVADCLSQAQALREDDDNDSQGDSSAQLRESRLQSVLGSFKSSGFGKLRTAWNGRGDHTSITPDLIPQLQVLLEKSSSTRLAVLCTTKVEHIKSQMGDFGWGCGYKSACMVFSALRHVEQYRNLLLATNAEDSDTSGPEYIAKGAKRKGSPDAEDGQLAARIPTIGELQEMAEAAWAAGFDPEGRLHFNGKLVGSRRWIGTSEVYIMFTWLGIRATVVDFPKVAGSRGAHTVLAKWVFDYFKARVNVSEEGKDTFAKLMNSNGSSVRICEDRMPLYLQHQGHSRVIVGVEETKAGDLNLLVFDCGKKIAAKLKESATSNPHKRTKVDVEVSKASPGTGNLLSPKLLEPFSINLKSLSKKDEYQILRIETEGGPLTPDEKLARREITSLRVTE